MKSNHTTTTKNFSLVGEAADFYIFSLKDSKSSGWIKGNSSLFFKLRNTFKKSKNDFDALCSTKF